MPFSVPHIVASTSSSLDAELDLAGDLCAARNLDPLGSATTRRTMSGGMGHPESSPPQPISTLLGVGSRVPCMFPRANH
jgi:hypothetical protein